MELLRLQNINYPIAVQETFKEVVPFPPPFLFNGHKFFDEDLSDRQAIPQIFLDHEFTAFLLNNHGESLAQMALFVFIGFLLILINRFNQKKNLSQNEQSSSSSLEFDDKNKKVTWLQKIWNVIVKLVVWNLVTILCVGNFMIGCVSANLEVFFFPISNGMSLINFILGFLLFFLNIFVIFHIFMLVYTADRIEWEHKQVKLIQPNKVLMQNKPALEMKRAMQKNKALFEKQMTKKEIMTEKNQKLHESFGITGIVQKRYMPVSNQDKKDFIKKYNFLYGDFKDDVAIQRYFIALDILRIYLVCLIITILTQYPVLQSILNTIIIFIYFALIVIFRPHKQFYIFVIILLMEVVLLVSYTMASLIAIYESNGYFHNTFQADDPLKTQFGDLMVLVALMMGFLSGLALIVTIIKLGVSLYASYNNKKEQQQYAVEEEGINKVQKMNYTVNNSEPRFNGNRSFVDDIQGSGSSEVEGGKGNNYKQTYSYSSHEEDYFRKSSYLDSDNQRQNNHHSGQDSYQSNQSNNFQNDDQYYS